ncbi:uncharacterized protein [Choristoneura fumiferana]|uniref:uncharacterized protein n=1 Tax=Choristoneura fumiferana TaxID=7141 RepID=UPI003D15ED18
MQEDEDEHPVAKKKSEVKPKRRRKAEKIVIPRRAPSVIVPGRPIIFITPDKTTCAECTCFPKEDPYVKNKKLNPCLQSPLTLYEYAAAVVDRLKYPDAYKWAEAQVAQWVGDVVGLPEYKVLSPI